MCFLSLAIEHKNIQCTEIDELVWVVRNYICLNIIMLKVIPISGLDLSHAPREKTQLLNATLYTF